MKNKSFLLVLCWFAVTSLVWLASFPFSSKFSSVDILSEGLYLLIALGSYPVVLKLKVPLLRLGWPIFSYGLLIDLLDEFTADKDFFNDPLEDVLNSFGLILVAYGFISSYQKILFERDSLRLTTKELETERVKLDGTLSSIADGVIATDKLGDILFMNSSACRMAGVSVGNAIQRPLSTVLPLRLPESKTSSNRSGAHATYNFIEGIGRGEITSKLGKDFLLSGTHDHDRIIEVFGSRLNIRDEVEGGVLLACRDVTQRRVLEREMQAANREESISLLAGGVAHDFNNILTAIQNWVSFGKSQNDTPEEPDVLSKIESACKRGKRLGTQLLSLSKGGKPIKTIFSLHELVEEESSFALRGSNVLANINADNNLWAAHADPGQISQVVHNLLINSRIAMPDGGKINIHIKNQHLGEDNLDGLRPGLYLELVVEDNGPGIDEEHRVNIFEPYFSTRKTGSGLGLASAAAIVRRHQGCIGVDCPTNGGTIFRILLPASQSSSHGDNSSYKPVSSGSYLLLVDDDISVREPLALSLRAAGYKVETASSGSEAVRVFSEAHSLENNFDLVVMDLTMPGDINGKDAMALIQELSPNARGIIVSGYHKDPVMAEFRKYGFSGVVSKPFEMTELIKTIEEAVSND